MDAQQRLLPSHHPLCGDGDGASVELLTAARQVHLWLQKPQNINGNICELDGDFSLSADVLSIKWRFRSSLIQD